MMKNKTYTYKIGGFGVGKETKMRAEALDMNVKDTGQRTIFETGSRKDMGGNRGRYDLLPLNTLAHLLSREWGNRPEAYFIGNIGLALSEPDIKDKLERLRMAYIVFVEEILEATFWETLPDLAKLYEAGAVKYEARDWEKGRPQEVFTNSILRHFTQYMNGEADEDHATAVMWNLVSLIDTLRRMPSMAYTIPDYRDK